MEYFVKRGEEKFGPYSLSDLQHQMRTGQIAAGDLAQSEGMNEWAPVSQVLGTIPAPAVTTPGATVAAPAVATVPLPPNLHWGFVFLLGAITRGLFNMIWALLQANWARKLINDNKPMVLVAMYPAGMIAGFVAMAMAAGFGHQELAALGGILIFAGLIVYIVGVFSIKHAMEDYYNSTEKIGLQLSGGMTFFFSTVYLQYHINRIARWKKTGVLS
jgi:hypothetical protein